MALFSLYVGTHTTPIFCLSISAYMYMYTVNLYYLSDDGLDSFQPSPHPWRFLYPWMYLDYLEVQ